MNKQQQVINLMKESNLDGLIFADGANFQYLLMTNHLHWQRMCMNNIDGFHSALNYPQHLLYIKIDGTYHIFTAYKDAHHFNQHLNVHPIYMEQLEDELACVLTGKNIGVGHDGFDLIKNILHNISSNITVVAQESILFELRAQKDPYEIEILKRNAQFTEEAFTAIIPLLKEGITQFEIEQALMNYGIKHNVTDFSFPPTAGFVIRDSLEAKTIFSFNQNQPLKENTGIAFDIGYLNEGYCADWGRTLYYGKASELVKNGYAALQSAQVYMVSKIIPNQTKVSELYGFILEEVTRLGYQDYLRFKDTGSLGHQIGIDCHEFPMLNFQEHAILKPGMVFCSEPKMWFENECYMRVEDMILITDEKAVFLTNFNRSLFEL